MPDKLERQVSLIRSETVLVYTGVQIFDEYGTRGVEPAIAATLVRKMLPYRNGIIQSSALVRRETAIQAGGYRDGISGCEDWDLWVRLQPLGQFEAVVDPLTSYYLSPQGLSADPEKMLLALDGIIDTTLLAGLQGLDRWAWRRRIRAVQLCSAGLIARENRLNTELRYMIRALCAWPSPLWEPRRFALFAVSARNTLRRGRGPL
jgi:hypothetical protein